MTTIRISCFLLTSFLAIASGVAYISQRYGETSVLNGLGISASPSGGMQLELNGVESTRTESLHTLEKKLKDRHNRKEELVTLLLLGQTNLEAVTQAYIRMNRDWSELTERITSAFPGESIVVGTARTVLQRAEGQLLTYPLALRLVIKERLLKEFNCLLHGHGS